MHYLTRVVIPFYALDQLTKLLVVQRLEFGSEHPVIPGFFSLVYWGNTGAAFSMLSGKSWLFVILASVTLLAMAVLAWRGALQTTGQKFTWSLLAAGIMGNLTDRLAHGHVVDFLLFDLHVRFANPWPAFNVADSCICVAAGLLIWQSLKPEKAVTGNTEEKGK